MTYQHTPVMQSDALELLNLQPGDKVIDCTLGGGGYSLALAALVGVKGKVWSLDLDPLAIAHVSQLLKIKPLHQLTLIEGNFAELERLVKTTAVNAIIFD